jgi:DNA mismatch repair ATPase MutS
MGSVRIRRKGAEADPFVKAYRQLKKLYPDKVVLVQTSREAFKAYDADASVVAQVCQVPLRRYIRRDVREASLSKGSLEENIRSLLEAGRQVALAERIEQ